MTTAPLLCDQIVSGGESFTNSSFGGFSVIVRDVDGYYCASKMVDDINSHTGSKKPFRHILVNVQFKKMCAAISLKLGGGGTSPPLMYELREGHTGDVTGTYVHPKLVHTIAEWASVEYLLIVTDIMDAMNELALAQQTTLATTAQQQVNSMKKIVAQLAASNHQHEVDIVALKSDKQQLAMEVQMLSSANDELASTIITKGVIKENYKIIVEWFDDMVYPTNGDIPYVGRKLYVQCLMQSDRRMKYRDHHIETFEDIPCAKDILHDVKRRLLVEFEPVKDSGEPIFEGACVFDMQFAELRPVIQTSVDFYIQQFGHRGKLVPRTK